MRKLTLGTAILAALALALLPMKASALLELDIGFDPTEACPGDQVHFFFSLENVGGQSEIVEVSVEIHFDDAVFGPFGGDFEMPAGEEISHELVFMIPPPAPPGTLTIYVTATDSDGMVMDDASLTILDCGGGDKSNPRPVVNKVKKELGKIGIK
jgi:hypothetical protein